MLFAAQSPNEDLVVEMCWLVKMTGLLMITHNLWFVISNRSQQKKLYVNCDIQVKDNVLFVTLDRFNICLYPLSHYIHINDDY